MWNGLPHEVLALHAWLSSSLEGLAMSISRSEAADFGPVNTRTDAVSAQHSQEMDRWVGQTQHNTDDLSEQLNAQMEEVQAAADDVQKSSQNLSIQAEDRKSVV